MLSLLLMALAAASPTTVPVFETDESEPGEDNCQINEPREVELTASFTVAEESWVTMSGLDALAEGSHALCDVYLDDLIVEFDGDQIFSYAIDEKGFGEGAPAYHLSERVDIPDLEKTRIEPGLHTLTVRLTGSADYLSERLRLTVSGNITHWRDYDGDESDDIELDGGDDCNDDNPTIFPGALEIWYDGVDQDCAGDDDYDQDGDGFQAEGEIAGGDDCLDTRDDAYPGAPEVWYDGIDQDCAGDDDYDQDGDGFQSPDHGGDDCDDEDGSKFPGARTWDEDCQFIVRDGASRTPPGPTESTGSGCTRGLPAVAGLLLLPLLAVSRRRRGDTLQ